MNGAGLSYRRHPVEDIEPDPDSDLCDLVPKITRLIGWMAEGKTYDQMGMRVVAMLKVVRPDFLNGQSLDELTPTTRQNVNRLMVDFRSTFGYHDTPHQRAKLCQR
jgi:hypothetical protein